MFIPSVCATYKPVVARDLSVKRGSSRFPSLIVKQLCGIQPQGRSV